MQICGCHGEEDSDVEMTNDDIPNQPKTKVTKGSKEQRSRGRDSAANNSLASELKRFSVKKKGRSSARIAGSLKSLIKRLVRIEAIMDRMARAKIRVRFSGVAGR